MVGFGEACSRFISRAFDFQGRSPRAEYWWPALGLAIAGAIVFSLAGALGELGLALLGIFYLAIIVPSISLGIRRLHDTDRSGWWYLLALIPFGSLVLLVFFCLEGTKGENKFGPDPYGGVSADVFS